MQLKQPQNDSCIPHTLQWVCIFSGRGSVSHPSFRLIQHWLIERPFAWGWRWMLPFCGKLAQLPPRLSVHGKGLGSYVEYFTCLQWHCMYLGHVVMATSHFWCKGRGITQGSTYSCRQLWRYWGFDVGRCVSSCMLQALKQHIQDVKLYHWKMPLPVFTVLLSGFIQPLPPLVAK